MLTANVVVQANRNFHDPAIRRLAAARSGSQRFVRVDQHRRTDGGPVRADDKLVIELDRFTPEGRRQIRRDAQAESDC